MSEEIQKRIEAIKAGKTPDGSVYCVGCFYRESVCRWKRVA